MPTRRIFVVLLLISASSRAQEIIHFQAANISVLRDAKNGLYFANFVKHEFKYLKVKPFMSLLVPNKKKCQVWCVKDLHCLSFNVGIFPNSGGHLECEILATDMFNSSKNMTDNVSYHHYTIKTGCDAMPCKNNGICQADYKTNLYSCFCQGPYYGENCEKDCNKPVGMQDGSLRNSQITASSYYADWNIVHFPWLGRLHHVSMNNKDGGCWASRTADIDEYLQIDLGTVMKITKVATQGRPSTELNQYVTKYILQYSGDNTTWNDYENPQFIKVFTANNDRNTVVTNVLEVPIKTRYVRIVVKEYFTWSSMRAELYGCPV